MSDGPGSTASRCEHCGQLIPKGDEWKLRQFQWGLLIAILTFIPFAMNIGKALREAKTTGLGAVAGGVSEIGGTFAFLAVIILVIGGIVFLVRGFTRESQVREILSILGITWLGFQLVSIVISVALVVLLKRQHP